MESKEKADFIKKVLLDHKAEEVEIYPVADLTPFSEYYIIATAPNERALGAYAEALEEELEKIGEEVRAKEGTPNTGWTIVDSGEVMVHLFLEGTRGEMRLEQLIAYRPA